MGKLHHKTLSAAVEKYGPLHKEGKTEEEIKAAIAADEKDFDQEGVDEIYATIVGETPTPPVLKSNEGDGDDKNKGKKGNKFIVATEFRDISDFAKIHKVGDEVSHFKKERLDSLVKNGHVISK